MSEAFRTPESSCPQCQYKMAGATGVEGQNGSPKEGSISVCLNCGQLLIFKSDLTLRRMTREEVSDVMTHDDVWQTVTKVQSLIEKRGRFHQ